MTAAAHMLAPEPQVEVANENDEPAFSWGKIGFTMAEVENPDQWSDAKKKQISDEIASDCYYSQYYDHQRSPYDRKFTNQVANVIITAKKAGENIAGALEESGLFGDPYDDNELWSEVNTKVEHLLDNLDEYREELEIETSYDREELQEELRDDAMDTVKDDDDSSVLDLIGSYDKVEIGFNLSPLNCIEDECVTINHIDDGLVGALGRIGYSLTDYRAHFNDKSKNHAKRRHKVWPQPLCTLQDIHELMVNACSNNFIFMIYAQVSLTDLINLDLTQPILLDQYAIASYNGWSGTFHDTSYKSPVILDPERAHLFLPGNHHSPDDICGLYGPAYNAGMSN